MMDTRTAQDVVAELRATLDGAVVTPDDSAYEDARRVFYRSFDRRPAAVVKPTDAREVSRVVSAARVAGAELAVRSGGHSLAGHGVSEGGIVLDLSELQMLDLDLEHQTAWAETGLTAGRYTDAAGWHGLATGFGDTGSVGLGGLTLGGGAGFLVRKHGLTIDQLLAAEVVTADGQLLHVDEETYPDLFWAIRGGGGNFGVATRFRFRLHPLAGILGGLLVLPGEPDVIATFVAAAEAAPEELSAIANIMVAPPMPFLPAEAHGKVVVMALVCWAGEVEEGERALAPFRALGPLADLLRPMAYPEIYALFGEGPGPALPAQEATRSFFVDSLESQAAEAIVDHLHASTASMTVAQLRVLGGAMARVSPEATAFAHRDRGAMVALGTLFEDAEDRPAHEAWLRSLAAAMRDGAPGAYVNFLGDEGEARVHEAYPGQTWDRLVEVKRRYDPTNFFRLNQNVDPGVSSARVAA
jgi:FAD/FMN-containing dehydrogenase